MELTPGQVRALPWPNSLLEGQPLQTREAYEVGRIIVKQLQGGEALQAQARREWSLRNIAKTIDVGSTATLGRCVQVFWVCEALGIASRLPDLPPHLLITAARLPVRQQLAFINKGVKGRWTRNHAIERANEIVGSSKTPQVKTPASRSKPGNGKNSPTGRVHSTRAVPKKGVKVTKTRRSPARTHTSTRRRDLGQQA
jgi:hypothetical protein